MKDSNEGGSRPPGSTRQQPAQAVAASTAESHAREGRASLDAGTRAASADMQQFIGRQLRAVFDDVAKQPIPDRFLELMKQLDGKTGTR